MKIFYDKRQSVKNNNSFSPSAGKPEKVLEKWKQLGFLIDVESPTPLTDKEFSLAHDINYVKAVLSCKRSNGFSNKNPEVAASLPWTSGSFVSAAKYTAKTKISSVSLTSGFHHACYDSCGGFCTFNGLIIASQVLKKEKLARKVAILDMDMHYGNGTIDIINHLKLDYIEHYTFGGHVISHEVISEWLESIPKIIKKFKGDGCEILLYQAGADPHINDPLGGVLTTKELKERDYLVFRTCKELELPIVWNLAGGYQHPIAKVLEIHSNTAIEFTRIFELQNMPEDIRNEEIFKILKDLYKLEAFEDVKKACSLIYKREKVIEKRFLDIWKLASNEK